MAILDPRGQPDPEREQQTSASSARVEIRPSRRVAHLAVRSLACPTCEMPLAIAGPVGWNEQIACAFCEGLAPTRAYVRKQGWPEVDLIARFD
jgi:hypothetical protein